MLWNSKNAWIVSIVYFSRIIANMSAAHCVGNFKVRKWEFDDLHSPPAIITQNLNVLGAFGNQAEIEVWLKDRQEDFNLTLFADPFIKHESNCSRKLQVENKNLRKFFNTCTIQKQDDESLSRSFGKIFTGCYYFVMTNKDGKNWQHGPLFYNTSYRYLDTKLEFEKEHYSFKPEDPDTTMELRVFLEVPLSCIDVKFELFEHEAKPENAIDEIKNGRVPASQKCFLRMIDKEVKPQCENAAMYTNLTLTVLVAKKREDGWTGKLVWEKLRRGGGNYYLHFVANPYTARCFEIYGGGNISTWVPIDGHIWKDLNHTHPDNTPTRVPALGGRPWSSIGSVVLGFVIFAILCYWAWKYRNIIRYYISGRPGDPGSGVVPTPVPVPIPIPVPDNESHQILLLYEKGSPEFMKKMSDFRDDLTKNCNNCSVHDVYAITEGNRVMELGAPGWVLELLEDGSKVVWVDTPEFRSRFNDKQQQYTSHDFRDNAVPYAVRVARECFQNATTQYCRHFVVRVKGFEVRDEENDPLRVVASYVRYRIPEQLPQLCESLRTPMERGRNTGDENIAEV